MDFGVKNKSSQPSTHSDHLGKSLNSVNLKFPRV